LLDVWTDHGHEPDGTVTFKEMSMMLKFVGFTGASGGKGILRRLGTSPESIQRALSVFVRHAALPEGTIGDINSFVLCIWEHFIKRVSDLAMSNEDPNMDDMLCFAILQGSKNPVFYDHTLFQPACNTTLAMLNLMSCMAFKTFDRSVQFINLTEMVDVLCPVKFACSLEVALALLLGEHAYRIIGQTLHPVLCNYIWSYIGIDVGAVEFFYEPDGKLKIPGAILNEHFGLLIELDNRKRGVYFENDACYLPKQRAITSKRVVNQPGKRDLSICREYIAAQVKVVEHGMHSHAPLYKSLTSLRSAQDIISGLVPQTEVVQHALSQDLFKNAGGESTHQRCLRYLADALEQTIKNKIQVLRDRGEFYGVGFASDESPPKFGRYGGLRLQITIVFIPMFPPVHTWEDVRYDNEPPIATETVLLDLLNCPGKDGAAVLLTIDKQMARINVSGLDVITGAGDGGGENEGSGGIHARYEAHNPLYIRRRCLGHLSWRICDNLLNHLSAELKQYKKVCNYLTEGMTWQRLKDIATLPDDAGGLDLMQPGTREFSAIFSKAPETILENRPETDYIFLSWLASRAEVLAKCAKVDVAQRKQEGPIAKIAMKAMADPMLRLQWCVMSELLRRGLYMFRFAQAHQFVVVQAGFPLLLDKATKLIVDLQVDADMIDEWHWDIEPLLAFNAFDKPWPVVLSIMKGYPFDVHSDILKFHLEGSTRMAAHAQLTGMNIIRTHTRLGAVLCTDARIAIAVAQEVHDMLQSKSDRSMTPFEIAFVARDVLMDELRDFAMQDKNQPVVLWRSNGRYQHLFKFLSASFLSTPDSVLLCEGVHGRWQHEMSKNKNQRIWSLNASMKLKYWMLRNGRFPVNDEFYDAFDLMRAAESRALRALYAAQVKNPLYEYFAPRFNIRAAELIRIRDALDNTMPKQVTFASSWSVYCRKILRPFRFYKFEDLHCDDLYFMIAEGKSVAGKEAKGDDEEQGRSVVLVRFTKSGEAEGGVIVERAASRESDIKLELLSISNLLRLAGSKLDVSYMDAHAQEVALESTFLDHTLSVFLHERITTEETDQDAYKFLLTMPQDAEHDYWEYTGLEEATSMQLARRIHLRTGEATEVAFRRHKDELYACLDYAPVVMGRGRAAGRGGRGAPAGPGLGLPAGRGRGAAPRGRGRGRGKGAGR
jgi:hypothetical protein